MGYSRGKGVFLGLIGGFLLILSLIVLIAFPAIYRTQLAKQTTLVKNTVLYDMWKDLPLPIYQKLYFYNITNHDKFVKYGWPLEVEQVGPYTYKSKWVKEDLEWQNGTVSYKERKSFYFDPEHSEGTENDTIYTLNGPLIFASSFLQDKGKYTQEAADYAFRVFFQEQLVIKKAIHEIAFGGYKDSILWWGKLFQKMPFEKGIFSWLYKRNDTDDGEFTVYTGQYNHSKLNFIKTWNGSSELSYWEEGSKCNKIEGTNAEVGPPVRENQTTYTFFQPIFCRSMTFDYVGSRHHRGIESKRFKNSAKVFANAKDNPDNYCFDESYKLNQTSSPIPSGVFNISSCQFNAPVLLSFPHFYLADDSYLDKVNGLNPNASLHESYIDVEPVTGASVSLAMRFQVNAYINQNQYLSQFHNVTSGVYPIFWMEMLAEIDDDMAKSMHFQLKELKQLAYSILGALIVIASFVFVFGLYIIHCQNEVDAEETKSLLEKGRQNSYSSTYCRDNFNSSDGTFEIPRGATTNSTSIISSGEKRVKDLYQVLPDNAREILKMSPEKPDTTSTADPKKTETIHTYLDRAVVKKMAKKCMSPKAAKWMIGIASVFFVLSIAILSIFPTIYKQMLAKTVALSDGSLGAKTWEDIPLPINENIYFFNITNGDAFLNKDEPLNVTEVGPYVYKGKWIKHNPKWHPNGTVSFRETRVWHFQPEMSAGSLDDVITTLNGPMIIGAHMLKDWNIFWRIFYSIAMKFESESVIIQRKVRELTYEGYEDPIIKYAPVLKPNIPFKDGIFMWLYDKNDTDDGEFTVFTGVDDASRTNVITSWNGNEKLNFWKGGSCNDINGTNVEMGPPLPDTPESYTFFQSIFCRSITYDYIGDTSSWGVPLKRFEPTAMVFGNSTENPDNACYEVNGERASGVLDVGPCQFDAPALLSYPHFHMADPSYVKAINGLSPKLDAHGSYLEVEPISGFTMNISIKFQMNIQMERVRGVLQFDNVPEGIFPVFWVDINIHLSEDWADFFKGQLNNPKYIVYSVCGFLLLASLVLIICGAVIITRSQKDDEDPLLNIQEEKKEELEKRKNTSEISSSYGGMAGDQGEQYDGDSLKQTDSHAAR
ncbi:uncharacterized protein [Parasteatoda tepidariorum]|uniref:uncharacterized protein n=1 Tax=Parasteatoda tepidariorum TaxID=114398 RepID=UPI0039BD9149